MIFNACVEKRRRRVTHAQGTDLPTDGHASFTRAPRKVKNNNNNNKVSRKITGHVSSSATVLFHACVTESQIVSVGCKYRETFVCLYVTYSNKKIAQQFSVHIAFL